MYTRKDPEYYDFKDIDLTKPIVLDFTKCKYAGEIHIILKEAFGLPEYYGQNWDALWDCLRGYFWGEGNVTIRIFGFYSMKEELQEYCIPMLKVFDDVHARMPNAEFELIS